MAVRNPPSGAAACPSSSSSSSSSRSSASAITVSAVIEPRRGREVLPDEGFAVSLVPLCSGASCGMGSPLSGELSPSIDGSISASAAAGIWAGADDAVAATARGCSGGAWAVGCATLLRCSCSKLSIFEFTSLIISASAPIWLCMKEIATAWLCSVLSHCCCSACADLESSWLSSRSSNPTGFECADADACESFSPPVLPLADAAESALATDARDGEAALLLRLLPSPLETPLGEPLVLPPTPLRSIRCTADVMLLRRAMLRPVLTVPAARRQVRISDCASSNLHTNLKSGPHLLVDRRATLGALGVAESASVRCPCPPHCQLAAISLCLSVRLSVCLWISRQDLLRPAYQRELLQCHRLCCALTRPVRQDRLLLAGCGCFRVARPRPRDGYQARRCLTSSRELCWILPMPPAARHDCVATVALGTHPDYDPAHRGGLIR